MTNEVDDKAKNQGISKEVMMRKTTDDPEEKDS